MNGYQGNYYRNQARYDRIDQDEVPESKHTVFLRGLPGHIKTDEVKDFFEDHVGPCSFDFIKLSPDQLKLFVAVRFETRDAAKECMHKYKDGEVLGYPVEMTWFKDIRRYVSYQQSQGLRPATIPRNRYNNRGNYGGRASYERSSRNDYRDDEYDRGSRRKRTSSRDRRSRSKRTRSRSNSSSRSPSRSPRHLSRDRSHSAASRRSDASRERERSGSRHSSASPPPAARERSASPPNAPSPPIKRVVEIIEKGSTPPLPPTPAPASASSAVKLTPNEKSSSRKSPSVSRSPSPVPERKSKKSKKEKKKRRRRSRSSSTSSNTAEERSSGELSEGELRKKILKKRQKQQIREEPTEPSVQTNGNGKALGKWEEKEPPPTNILPPRPESSLQNITLKFGLESAEDIPKQVMKETQPQTKKANAVPSSPTLPGLAAVKQEQSGAGDMRLTPPPIPPRFSKSDSIIAEPIPSYKTIDDKKIEAKSEATSSGAIFSTDIDSLFGKRSSSLAQNSFLDDMKGGVFPSMRGGQQPQASMRSILDDPDEPLQSTGSLRLSSFTRQLTAESERDRKLARLPPEMLAKFAAKKKQFDAALKADCETFAFVTKTLLQKDPGLEDRLRAALAEAVRDIEESFTVKIDQFLDQLIMFMSM